jgi:ribokinase
MAGKIVILGVFVADTTYRADRFPAMGETLLGNAFALGPGGKGSNQAVAAARAGAEVEFVARLGRDTFADMAREIWAGAGVSDATITDDETPTGAACIFVEETSGNNAIIICPGAGGKLTVADVEARADLIGSADIFMTQLEQPMDAALRGLRIARDAGVTTILNPAPAAALPEGMLALCDYATPNESEVEALTGVAVRSVEDARAAAAALMAAGVGAAVITLGEKGVYFDDGTTSLHLPALKAGDVVETTGAGDAFNGGFAAALAAGISPAEAVRFGNATAALSVTKPGTAGSMPERTEIDALLARG